MCIRDRLKAALESTDDDRLHALAAQIDLMTDVRDRIAREIYPDPLNNQIQDVYKRQICLLSF